MGGFCLFYCFLVVIARFACLLICWCWVGCCFIWLHLLYFWLAFVDWSFDWLLINSVDVWRCIAVICDWVSVCLVWMCKLLMVGLLRCGCFVMFVACYGLSACLLFVILLIWCGMLWFGWWLIVNAGCFVLGWLFVMCC